MNASDINFYGGVLHLYTSYMYVPTVTLKYVFFRCVSIFQLFWSLWFLI